MNKPFSKLLVTSIACLLIFTSCSNASSDQKTVSFSQDTYLIKSGNSVTVSESIKGVTYQIKNNPSSHISLDSATGTFTFDSLITNYTQVMYTATYNGKETAPVVVTLTYDYDVPDIKFLGNIDSLCDGDHVLASTSNGLALSYQLVGEAPGVELDYSTGLIKYGPTALEGNEFKVKVSANGASQEKIFKVAKINLAKASNDSQCCEESNLTSVKYKLDFADVPNGYSHEVTGVSIGNKILDSSIFTYNKESETVSLDKSIFDYFVIGAHTIGLITPRNVVKVEIVKASKFVKTPEDIVNINASKDALAGYYVLANDIDLTDYLSIDGDGYNGGKFWTPIGKYHDTTDETSTADAFKGTFDGNGHIISGFKISRQDEAGFNAGLFGYTLGSALIKNLGLEYDQTTPSKVASYCGGFVGVNNGTVANCWANVNISQPDSAYRCLGGFCGRNYGEIYNSFVYGNMSGYTGIGAFSGQSSDAGIQGVFYNCYACTTGATTFNGAGSLEGSTYQYVPTLDEMKKLDYSMYQEKYWDVIPNELPVLKTLVKFDKPYAISFNKVESFYEKGDSFDLEFKILPSELEEQYKDKAVITSDDPNVSINGTHVTIGDNANNEIGFKVTLDSGEIHLEDYTSINVYDILQKVEIIDDNPSTLIAGHRYRFNHTIYPSTAIDNAYWYCSDIDGASMEGNILTLSEEVISTGTFTVAVKVGKKTATKTFKIKSLINLGSVVTAYKDQTKDIEFNMKSGLDLTNMRVERYGKSIDYKVDSNKVTISLDLVKELPNIQVPFTFTLNNGDIYRAYAVYMDRNIYTKEDAGARAIPLKSAADFEKYFNVKDYDPDRFDKYYDKVFVLSNDIDFENAKIYGIGWYSSEYGPNKNQTMNRAFSGKIYGLGHTIKNVYVSESERYFDSQTDKTGAHRSSLYNVGFFGSLTGQVYDINFDNCHVSGASRVGTLVGSLRVTGIISNIHFTNSSVTNAGGTDHSDDTYVTGRIASSCGGTMINCTYNGLVTGLVG